METTESIPIKSAIIRNSLGHIQNGSGGINPYGRPSVGRTVAETFRAFLAAKDKNDKTVKSRLNKQMQVLYEISVDKDHKQCVQAAIYCQTRAYGNIPTELSKSALAATLLEGLPPEDKAFIAQLAFKDNSMLLPADTIEDDEEETNEDDSPETEQVWEEMRKKNKQEGNSMEQE